MKKLFFNKVKDFENDDHRQFEEVGETTSMLTLEPSAPKQIHVFTVQNTTADSTPFVISTLSDLEWWTSRLQSEVDQGKWIKFPPRIFSVLILKKACQNGYSSARRALDRCLNLYNHNVRKKSEYTLTAQTFGVDSGF